MTKKIIATLILIILVATVFAGCETYRRTPLTDTPDVNALVESNGGLAVKQGDYIYFINAQSDYNYTASNQNYFNHKKNENKGAIMRIKLDASGNIDGEAEIVVPKNAMTSYAKGGIYVYGEWIYYTSPTTRANSAGIIKNDLLFYRTKIDGTGTQVIATVNSRTFEYTVTPSSIVYYIDNELYYINTDVKRGFKAVKIDEKITSIIFPVNSKYDPANPNYLASAVFYSKASEDDTVRANEVYGLDVNGNKTLLFNESSYTAEPKNIANIEKVFTITLKDTVQTDKGIALLYEKSYYRGNQATSKGLYSLEFIDNSLDSFNVANEKLLSKISVTPLIKLNATTFYYLDNTTLYKVSYDEVEKEPIREMIQEFTSVPTILFFNTKDNINYVYYVADDGVYRYPLTRDDEGNPTGNATFIKEKNMSTSWLSLEKIGDLVFYTNSGQNNYTYVMKLSTYDPMDDEALYDELAGRFTEADQLPED